MPPEVFDLCQVDGCEERAVEMQGLHIASPMGPVALKVKLCDIHAECFQPMYSNYSRAGTA